jgi:hypothetical protein
MPLLDVFLATMWFFLWVLWIFLVVRVIVDVFRSRDLSGWGKAGWLIFTIILPFLGVFVYLIARGRTMTDRELGEANARDERFRSYVREAARPDGTAAEIAQLAELRDRGVINADEFQKGKDKILSAAA